MDPEVTAHFDDIHEVLLTELGRAEHSISAAVAWFTDREILATLRRRAGHGVSIHVAVTDDDINRPPKAPPYDPLISLGGVIHRVPPGSRNESLMHHNFCVIDEQTVITGSYNWTRRARENDENVTVVRGDPAFAAGFLNTFDRIIERQGSDALALDGRMVRKRLEMVRNLIQLGETEDAEPHLRKLRPFAEPAGLTQTIRAIESGDYEQALERIESWLSHASALISPEDAEVPHLRLWLEALEFQLEALTSEQADLERRLVVFNRRHDEALGGWTEEVLGARAELARLKAEQARAEPEAEEEAERAQQQYRDYADEHERLQESPAPPRLDEEREAELKQLYRQASQRCHPDKVDDASKAQAVDLFQALQAAYQAQDFEAVREIHQTVMSGSLLLAARSSTLSRADRLRAAVAQLEHQIAATVRELRALKQSDAVALMESLEENAEAWDDYIRRRREELREELASLQEQIRAYQSTVDF